MIISTRSTCASTSARTRRCCCPTSRRPNSTLRYITELGARFVFPTAGPPCFLDEELWGFNDIFGDESNIFPDQRVYLDWLGEQGHVEGRLLLPGSVADLADPDCPVSHPIPD